MCECVCVYTRVWGAYRCACQSECSPRGPEREAQAHSGSGVVMAMACVLSTPLSLLSGNGGVYMEKLHSPLGAFSSKSTNPKHLQRACPGGRLLQPPSHRLSGQAEPSPPLLLAFLGQGYLLP